jgi:hypothetical protein
MPPAHYVYIEPDPTTLNQGDVFDRTTELLGIIAESHPQHAADEDIKFFLMLTQSCDLVRRGGICGAEHLQLAAVVPVDEAVRREAAKWQESAWQRELSAISSKDREKIFLFILRLIDNNEPGLFFLHQDVQTKIHLQCCAILARSITIPCVYYDACLRAKVAQLTDTFQAKLGSLIGSMYNRVGTVEWDSHYKTNPVANEANKILRRTLRVVPEDQMREGLADLKRQEGGLAGKSAEEIYNYITKTKILSRAKKFEQRAVPALRETVKPMSQIKGRVQTALKQDAELRAQIAALLTENGVADAPGVTDQVMRLVLQQFGVLLTDEGLPDGERAMQKIIAGLMQDPQIAKIMQ